MELRKNTSPGASITQLESAPWRLEIPPGPKGRYRLAQLDDYSGVPRKSFPWQPPLTLNLQARVSSPQVPGTWGFGLWNDPFSLALGLGGGIRRFPYLPNAAWFFFASPENYLSFQDDKPAQGFLVHVFRAPQIPAPLLALGGLCFPLFAWPWAAKKLRRGLGRLIQEDAQTVRDFVNLEGFDMSRWHAYELQWKIDRVIFKVDDHIFETPVTPNGPLGLVIWIDNQYAAFSPDGRLAYGTLLNPESAWLEIASLKVE